LSPVSAVLLAAGSGKRMGRLKQLLPLGDTTVIQRCLDTIITAETEDIVVVLAPGKKKLMESINDYPVTIAVNEDVGSDMAESVKVGLAAADGRSTGVIVCLADHPLVSPETFKLILAAHRKEPHRIIIPLCKGRRGHPALFPKSVIHEIFTSANLREIIRKDPGRVKLIEVRDEGVIIDMDTKEDYLAIIGKMEVVQDVEGP
jgi:molybdenum cofactor cytidylyltransferase